MASTIRFYYYMFPRLWNDEPPIKVKLSRSLYLKAIKSARLLSMKCTEKPQKRYVVTGIIRTVSNSHAIADVVVLKGQCHEIFDFRVFSCNFPQDPEYPISAVSKFCWKIRGDICSSRCTTGHRWQIEKSSLKKKFYYFD